MRFGPMIRKYRMQRQLALRQVAYQIDLDQSTLSKVERGELIAPERIVKPLAKCLGVPYKELQIQYLSERLILELKDMDYHQEALEVAKEHLAHLDQEQSEDSERSKLLSNIQTYLAQQPIEKAWLFGSFARGEEGKDSDIDILVRFKQPHKVDLFEYVGMRQDLEDLTGRSVDLVEEGQELSVAQASIAREKKLIYERKTT